MKTAFQIEKGAEPVINSEVKKSEINTPHVQN